MSLYKKTLFIFLMLVTTQAFAQTKLNSGLWGSTVNNIEVNGVSITKMLDLIPESMRAFTLAQIKAQGVDVSMIYDNAVQHCISSKQQIEQKLVNDLKKNCISLTKLPTTSANDYHYQCVVNQKNRKGAADLTVKIVNSRNANINFKSQIVASGQKINTNITGTAQWLKNDCGLKGVHQ